MDRKKIFFVTLFSTIFMALFFILIAFITILIIDGRHVSIYLIFIIVILFIVNAITSFYILNSKKRIMNVKLCWIFVINCLPIVGIFTFFIFGIIPFKIKTTKEIKKHSLEFDRCEDLTFTKQFLADKTNIEKYSDFQFIYNYSNSAIYQNNSIEIIDQSDMFKTTIEYIRKAKEFIHLQYYIVSDSAWFYFLIEELVKKSKEGVKVRFMFDWAGSHKRFKVANMEFMQKNGIEILTFNPQGFNKYTSITNFRSHRKALIVDNKYCITGGSNIGDEYINLKKGYDNWKDLNFLLEGEIVNSINLRFCNDWIYYTNFYKDKTKDDKFYKNFKIHQPEKNEKMICQIVNSSPEFDVFVFQSTVSAKISNAKKSIWIFTPYLLIPEEITNQLIFAGIRGLDVRIMVPHFPDDKKFILAGNRSMYSKLMNAKVKIFEYYGFLHSKAIIIDDDQVLIGTNNMDFRSLIINFETSISVISPTFNKKMKKIFLADQKTSKIITKEYLEEKLKLKTRIFIGFIRVIQPLL